MTLREFFRYHLLKVLLVFIVIQLGVIAFIQNYDHPPVAVEDKASVPDRHTVKISPLDNDTDKDKNTELSVQRVSSPKHGVSKKEYNSLYYTPNKDFVGTDSITYTISDGKKESKKAYILIKVEKNLAPVAGNDTIKAYIGNSMLMDVLKNDNDREGDSVFIAKFTQPTHGQVNVYENNLVYVADNSSAVSDSFLYTASDGVTNSKTATVFINRKGKTDPCYPWLSSDIGDAAHGSFTCGNKTFTIEASGSDIWNTSDGCRCVYQFVNGDFEMYAKVESIEETNKWAKAGIMARESLNGGSKMAFVLLSAKKGTTCHWRLSTDEKDVGGDRLPDISAPYWLKLGRKGNTFGFYISPDGRNWKKTGETIVPMAQNIYLGFAVTSHDNSKICKAVFSHFRFIGKTAKF